MGADPLDEAIAALGAHVPGGGPLDGATAALEGHAPAPDLEAVTAALTDG
jgi:hypothetical protein